MPPPFEIGPKLSDTFRLGIEPNTAPSTAESSETIPIVMNLAENVPKQVDRVCCRGTKTLGESASKAWRRDKTPSVSRSGALRGSWAIPPRYISTSTIPGIRYVCPAGLASSTIPPFLRLNATSSSQVWQLERRRGQFVGQVTRQVRQVKSTPINRFARSCFAAASTAVAPSQEILGFHLWWVARR